MKDNAMEGTGQPTIWGLAEEMDASDADEPRLYRYFTGEQLLAELDDEPDPPDPGARIRFATRGYHLPSWGRLVDALAFALGPTVIVACAWVAACRDPDQG